MSDPFPGLPRRVLFVDVEKPTVKKSADATKLADATKKPATKIPDATINATKKAHATEKRRGRPPKDKAMTSTERSRLRRAAKKLG